MTIYLVQHGKSVPKEEDRDRPLSTDGVHEVEKIAAQLKVYEIDLKSIYHTSKLRAVQTAEILELHLNASQGTIEKKGMNPMDDVRVFAKSITETDSAMYVGHLPFMEKLVSYLVTGDEERTIFKFQYAGIVKLDHSRENNAWVISGVLLPRPV